jgi:antitoxin component of RelBE/YafQ-DinJ toxin-antitoxin module
MLHTKKFHSPSKLIRLFLRLTVSAHGLPFSRVLNPKFTTAAPTRAAALLGLMQTFKSAHFAMKIIFNQTENLVNDSRTYQSFHD